MRNKVIKLKIVVQMLLLLKKRSVLVKQSFI